MRLEFQEKQLQLLMFKDKSLFFTMTGERNHTRT